MKISNLLKKWHHRLIRLTPGQLVIQITDRCNATCPQCGMRISSDFKRQTLPRKTVFQIIEAAARHRIKAISFTGGEPFLLLDDVCDYIQYAGTQKIPFIRTGTNGFHFTGVNKPNFRNKIEKLAEKLSKTPLRNFWISLDSCDPLVHEQMRGFDNIVEGIAKALPIFENHGIYPSVNLGINRNLGGKKTQKLFIEDFKNHSKYETAVYKAYCKAFSRFYQTAVDLGFTIANACYPMSVETDSDSLDPVYQASAADRVIKFSKVEKKKVFKALMDTIPKFRDKIRIFSPQATLYAMVKDLEGNEPVSYACQGGINYFFVEAQSGDTYPCGYRGSDNMGKLYEPGFTHSNTIPDCRECDWECFRDPSELTGPVIDLFSYPHRLVQKTFTDPNHLKLWATDILYYTACNYFNGRIPPEYSKMSRFSKAI